MVKNPPIDKDEFDIKKSPLKKAFKLLNARNLKELYDNYLERDQELIKRGTLDYEDPESMTTKIKNILENVDDGRLSKKEKEYKWDILWLWYHHGISYAVWHYIDKKKALIYSAAALKYQGKDHPNKITPLLYFLIRDQLPKAEKLLKIIKNESEKSTAKKLVKFYKEGGFFKKS